MIIDFIIEDLMLNSYLQKNFHTLIYDVLLSYHTKQLHNFKNCYAYVIMDF